MAEEAHYESHKRKYENTSPPPSRRPTGFSAPILPSNSPDSGAPPAATYGSVTPPLNEFQLAKQNFQELACRALNTEAKRSKGDNGGFNPPIVSASSDQKFAPSNTQSGNTPFPAQGYSGSKRIEIPNGRVGVIIGKAGETIKYLQVQSGARIQVTRDAEHDLNLPNRTVELMGNPDQIAKAEQLINEVLSEASVGGSGAVSRKFNGMAGSEQFVMRVPNNKVGLVIGKGGETIKNIQARSGAKVQVIPLHPPPGDMSSERTVQIDGTSDQIEIAKQMVNEVIQNRVRNPVMAGGYSQQGYQYQAQASSWAPQPPQLLQPGSYSYMQQPGATSQYGLSQPPYSGYPQGTTGGYARNWDKSSAPQSQQAPQGSGYDYYGQQAPLQQQPASGGPPTDNTGYNYSQPPTSGCGCGQQGYTQDGYGGGYRIPAAQHGYGQRPPNPSSGYDQQHGYGSVTGYGHATNPLDGHPHPPNCSSQGETGQQQGSTGQPNAAAYSTTQGSSQAGYGMQAGYGTQGGYGSTPVYGAPQDQTTLNQPTSSSSYGQPQQSPTQGRPVYPCSQPPPQSGSDAHGAAPYPSPYGSANTVTPPGDRQQPPAYYGAVYSCPPACPTDAGTPASAPSQAVAQPASKTSSQSW